MFPCSQDLEQLRGGVLETFGDDVRVDNNGQLVFA
jgi:hypothetical protein